VAIHGCPTLVPGCGSRYVPPGGGTDLRAYHAEPPGQVLTLNIAQRKEELLNG
jgi:hypothetical protein